MAKWVIRKRPSCLQVGRCSWAITTRVLFALTVSTLPADRCSTAKYLKLHHPTGYIASVVTEETGCGSQQNPWVITAQAGQKINITLFDFGTTGSLNSSSNPGAFTAGNSNKRTNYPVYCQQYVRIEEKDVARSTIVCGGERREKNVYISVTNEVQIQVMNRRTIGQPHYFLLKYNGKNSSHITITIS